MGHSPVPPAQLALAIILQAYLGISDDEVIEEMVMDQRWQLVLDCLNCETPPLGKATLIRFRNGLIKKEVDQRLIDRTVEIAKQKGGFGSSQLKAALDSSPLWGGGKVEDTYNLLGHAFRKAVSVIGSIPILQVYKSMIEYIVFCENRHLASPKNMFESQSAILEELKNRVSQELQ